MQFDKEKVMSAALDRIYTQQDIDLAVAEITVKVMAGEVFRDPLETALLGAPLLHALRSKLASGNLDLQSEHTSEIVGAATEICRAGGRPVPSEGPLTNMMLKRLFEMLLEVVIDKFSESRGEDG